MEYSKNMRRRNILKLGVKQTSTPLIDNKEVVFLKTLSNISSIQNEYRGKKNFVIESPSIFDLDSPLQNSGNTETSEHSSESQEETSKQRPDTPFKSQKKVRFSSPLFVCPVKLRFSEISNSSSANSKQSDVMRRCSTTVNKHLLYTSKKPENNNRKRCLKKFKKHELRNEKIEKEISSVSFEQRAYAKLSGKSNEKKKSLNTNICGRSQVTGGLDLEKEVGMEGLSDLSNTVLNENTCIEVEIFRLIKGILAAKRIEKRENTSNNLSKHQEKDVISHNLINETDFSVERHFDKTICPSIHVRNTNEDILQQEIDQKNARKAKESYIKPKGKSGKKHEPKKIVGPQSTGPDGTLELDSNNIQSGSNKKVIDKVSLFKKPFMVKKKAISKQLMLEKKKKRIAMSLFPPTSTPFDSPTTAKGKLPMVFEALSPVRSPEKRNKSYCWDDFQTYGIKVKRTYSKAANFQSESLKENSKWESFLKKPSYHRKNSNYVSEISMSERNDSIRLYESPPNDGGENTSADSIVPRKKSKASERISRNDIDEDVTVQRLVPENRVKTCKTSQRVRKQNINEGDPLILESRLKKSNAFERTSRQDIGKLAAVDHLIPRSRLKQSKASKSITRQDKMGGTAKTTNSKNKKWFETTKLKEIAAHFNEIADTSLFIEIVPKKK